MARIYKNNKTNTTVMTGSVKSVAEDRMSFTLSTQEYDKGAKKNVEKEILIKSATPLEPEVVAASNITCVGYIVPDPENPEGTTAQAMYVSTKSQSWDYKTLSVVNGDVSFARYVDEKNEDGTPKMTKPYTDKEGTVHESKAKSPHYDIGIQTLEADDAGGTKRVLHTIRVYAYQNDNTQIERMQKLFGNFDKETNPAYATIVTQPGREYSTVNEYNGKEYTNFYCQHMGISSIDVNFTKERVQQKNGSEVKAQPAAENPAPVPTTNGLDSGNSLLEHDDAEPDMFV